MISGVSANSWFSPLVRESGKHIHQSHGVVHKEIAVNLKLRAQSASAVLGRRHYDVQRQTIASTEVLKGVAINGIAETNKRHTAHRNAHATNTVKRDGKQVNGKPRPHTSLGIRRQGPERNKEWCELVITSVPLNAAKCRQKDDVFVSNNHRPDTSPSMRKGTLETHEADCFKTIDEMKKAYHKRVKSAPPVVPRRVPDCENRRQQDRIATPVFWKTRDTHHRKYAIITGSEERLHDTDSRNGGSLLRSLLQTCDSGFKHSASCPYKCKGCFKVCLASGDYVQKLREQKEMAPVAPRLWEYRRRLKFMVDKQQPPYE